MVRGTDGLDGVPRVREGHREPGGREPTAGCSNQNSRLHLSPILPQTPVLGGNNRDNWPSLAQSFFQSPMSNQKGSPDPMLFRIGDLVGQAPSAGGRFSWHTQKRYAQLWEIYSSNPIAYL